MWLILWWFFFSETFLVIQTNSIFQHNAERLLKLIEGVYRWLPLGTVVNNKVLIVHGGISDTTDLDLIRSLDRGKVSKICFFIQTYRIQDISIIGINSTNHIKCVCIWFFVCSRIFFQLILYTIMDISCYFLCTLLDR